MRTIHWPDWALLTLALGVLCFAASTSSASVQSCLGHPGSSMAGVSKQAQRPAAACGLVSANASDRRKP